MAVFADKAFALLGADELTAGFAWLGAIAYTMQIYFDFSGYSDMAIGLGSMLGFEFPENFNYPYISRSITEFWRRWHISLSTWFRDYVYIPLGGNRCSKARMLMNMGIVWILTGVWHGANYTFWLWGVLYFILLAAEKIIIEKIGHNNERQKVWKAKAFNVIGHVYTMLAVMLLWVLFRADSVSDAVSYYACMFGRSATTAYALGVTKLYWKNAVGCLLIALIGCVPVCTWIMKKLPLSDRVKEMLRQIAIIIIFVLGVCVTVDSSYNPFIYFNF
jgi:D-alanyl-lipoteichoic acid acyltransferase DltB (MBOAT superfamily)